MKKLLGAIVLLLASASIYAADYTPEIPLDFDFSVYLDRPVSGESDLKQFFVKGGVYRTFGVFCEKTAKHCSLWVYDIADEYCNGKGSPQSQDTIGFNYNYYPDISLRRTGSDISFEFDDVILYGGTHNAIKVTLASKPNSPSRTIVTHADGIASALRTTQGVPLQSRYRQLDTRVLCNLGFFPPAK